MAKKATKTVTKLKKQSNVLLVFLVVLLVVTNGITIYLWSSGYSFKNIFDELHDKQGEIVKTEQGNTLKLAGETPDKMDAYYLDIVNIGDSNLIKLGDYEILIDAGEKRDGTDVVVPKLNELVTDGVIELVIVTHSDSDHNGGFVGLKENKNPTGVYYADFQFSYITDYGYREKYEETEYEVARNYAIEKSGTIYQSINDAFSGNDNTFQTITIGSNFKLEFINTFYYDIYGSDVNDRSITCLLTYYDHTFFYGGDINKEQEKLLIEKYQLPQIDFYKASHHGSITSNCAEFLDVINPSYIFLNTEIGNRHNIPNIASLTILQNYADNNMYLTGVNGTINVHCKESNFEVIFEKNNTKFIDTSYFKDIMDGLLHK